MLDDCEHGWHPGEFTSALAEAWRDPAPDVVHAHSWLCGLTALLAVRQRRPLPIVQTFHENDGNGSAPGSRVEMTKLVSHARIERAVARNSQAVVVTSETELARLARLGVARRRIAMIPCGAVTQVTDDTPTSKPPGRLRLVVLDPLGRSRGVDDVVTALRGVPHTELVLAGGPCSADRVDEREVCRIRELAHRLGVGDRVRLLGGIPSCQLPTLLAGADAVVSVPWANATGQVALDAMACGLPVVCTRVGGLADIVVDGITGVCVPPRRPDLLSRALRGFLAAPDRRVALAIAGRDRVLSRYGWARIGAETVRLYERLLGR
jgi:glycosyltransferase involved in cell wall biosynthesis